MSRMRSLSMAGLVLASAGSVLAYDPWELEVGDNASFASTNVLRHGVVQQGHDLEGPPSAPDQDWSTFVAKLRHSYEARVSGLYWNNACVPLCPQFDRVDASGVVLTPGVASSEDIPGESSLGRTVRWIAAADGPVYLRTIGDQFLVTGPDPYDIVYYDTTLFVPRFNNTATQTTVLVLQNTTDVTVTGMVHFYDGSGFLITSVPLSVPQHGVQLMSTAAIPGLAGQSGSVQVAQLGGYGAITGKAVALEPATGFTFDTAVVPLSR